jgi:hypothetical protein
MDFRERIVDYIIHIHSQKDHQVTKRSQNYDAVGYYIMIGYLKSEGIIFHNGFQDGQKLWKLTPRGMKVSKLLIELKKEVDTIFEGTKEVKE